VPSVRVAVLVMPRIAAKGRRRARAAHVKIVVT
jgi:hypothetical protein